MPRSGVVSRVRLVAASSVGAIRPERRYVATAAPVTSAACRLSGRPVCVVHQRQRQNRHTVARPARAGRVRCALHERRLSFRRLLLRVAENGGTQRGTPPSWWRACTRGKICCRAVREENEQFFAPMRRMISSPRREAPTPQEAEVSEPVLPRFWRLREAVRSSCVWKCMCRRPGVMFAARCFVMLAVRYRRVTMPEHASSQSFSRVCSCCCPRCGRHQRGVSTASAVLQGNEVHVCEVWCGR